MGPKYNHACPYKGVRGSLRQMHRGAGRSRGWGGVSTSHGHLEGPEAGRGWKDPPLGAPGEPSPATP